MAQRQRVHHRVTSVPEAAHLVRKNLKTRRAITSRRRITYANPYISPSSSSHSRGPSSSPPQSQRQVLIPLQFNLRRLPSRSFGEKDSMRHEIDTYHRTLVGTKRKRAVSGAENTASGRILRGSRVKRRKATHDSSDDEVTSGMDVDDQSRWEASDNSEDEQDADSSDNFLINEAHPRQLLRLRKDELVRLYTAAGLSDDAELLTKPEIVDCIIAARDDVAELPPSSPPTAIDSGSSDYSSDGGNVAGGEETDFTGRTRHGLRRRATMADLSHSSRARPSDRCLSLGQIDPDAYAAKRSKYSGIVGTIRTGGPSTRRRGMSNASSIRSSPTSSAAASLPSPPVTRLRSRKSSNEEKSPTPSSSSSHGKGKGKGKQVGFSEDVQVSGTTALEDESDLTDLTEIEESIAATSPSPRRLRSKGERTKVVSRKGKERADDDAPDASKRVTPMRRAKQNVGSLAERDDEDEEDQDQLESDVEQEEEDQLASPSPLSTPQANVKRTPVKRRLRPRRIQTHTPPSDGDDEQSADEDVEESIDGEQEGSEDDESTVAGDQSVEEEPPVEARVLRSGKVVGEEDEESIGDEDEDDEDDEEDEDYHDSSAEIDIDAEGEVEEGEENAEPIDDDISVDLTIATTKTLVRLRRDDLVRLCETRDIEATGTKPQLAEALLQWRERHYSSPSSTRTVRPPSTTRPRANGKRKSKSASQTPPVLDRSDRVHLDEPRTPPVSERTKANEPELELDLESLGLEDREIPPDKLTKLEKIGSGGFKDVFIGKFKGRRVAIAEFRGQLSEMDIKELKLLGDFDHPNIVKFLGVSIPENTKETPVMIVSELCSNGDLFDYVRNVNPPSLYRVLSIMLDIAQGLEYLHTRKPSIIHRDCKSSNILITSKGIAKITDFGLAKVKQSTRSMVRSLVGTVNWQAPELWHPHPKYNHKVDVFSCAMVYWEMLQWHVPNKKFPWEGMNEHAIYDIVGHKRQRPSISGLRKHWCPEIVDLMERMWAHEPNERPTMTQVVEELEEL
ncbi:uncharacterized protein C8Q71DRAFT_878937, partial [Rhodofomes roseus]